MVSKNSLIPAEKIDQSIVVLRDQRVMLDRDLAKLYGVTTSNLNKAVTRNIERFPDDFVFRLSKEGLENKFDQQFKLVFDAIREMMKPPTKNQKMESQKPEMSRYIRNGDSLPNETTPAQVGPEPEVSYCLGKNVFMKASPPCEVTIKWDDDLGSGKEYTTTLTF